MQLLYCVRISCELCQPLNKNVCVIEGAGMSSTVLPLWDFLPIGQLTCSCTDKKLAKEL